MISFVASSAPGCGRGVREKINFKMIIRNTIEIRFYIFFSLKLNSSKTILLIRILEKVLKSPCSVDKNLNKNDANRINIMGVMTKTIF